MSNMNKYEKLLYKTNRLKRHCGNQMNKIVKLKQELQRKDNIINELEEKLISVCETCYEDKETARIKKWIDKIKELEEDK